MREALASAAESTAALAQNEAKMAGMKLRMEANESVENELTEALEASEDLLKEGLELAEQLKEKNAKISAQEGTVAELREQVRFFFVDILETCCEHLKILFCRLRKRFWGPFE